MAVDEEELNSIQTRILPAMLQKLGINRNLPTAIGQGLTEFGGIALLDLRTELGIKTIKYLRNAVYSQSATGSLCLSLLKHHRQEAGIGNHLLEVPDIHVPYLTPTWLTSIRQYMPNHNISITITDVLESKPTQTGDSFPMVKSHLDPYTVPQQRDINLVRLHLQAANLSDLASEDGKQITSHGLAGKHPINFISTATWPRQDTPTHHQRRLWRNYISSSFLRYPPYFLHNIGPPSLSPPSTTDPHFPTPEPPASYKTLSAYIAALPRTHRHLLSCFTQ